MDEADNGKFDLLFLPYDIDYFYGLNNSYYRIEGIVTEGNQIGRTIGFPTANIKFDVGCKIPQIGVYAVFVQINGQKYKGMLNIGIRPTFGFHDVVVEVHLFDFDQVVYGLPIEVLFVKKVREELRFESVEMLIDQLKMDKQNIQAVLDSGIE